MYKKTVILAEKPNQAKDNYATPFEIEKKEKTHYVLKPCDTFPNGAILTWAFGHLVELKMPQEYNEKWGKWNLNNLPIIPENFNFEFKVSENSKSQYRFIEKAFNQADTIINSVDPDREGSNIFYNIYNMTGAKNKEIKRLWINSLSPKAVKDGFNNLLDNKKDFLLYKEASTRMYADWLVGINASQLYTLLLQQKGLRNQTISAGRIQSPTTYMIYERQKEIENFVSKPFYELYADIEHDNGKYQGKAKLKENDKKIVMNLLDENDLSNMRTDKSFIKNVEKEQKETKAPQLHSLSTLQIKANKKWKYNSSKTLELVQSLYEKKILTYPRTDTVHITESEYNYLKDNLENYKTLLNVSFENNFEVDKRHVASEKVQEHHAIIMTENVPSKSTIDKLREDEKNIFYEIMKTTLSIFSQPYKYEETNIITDINSIEFFTKGKVEISKGWKSLFEDEKEQKKETNETLPLVSKDDIVKAELNVKEGHTIPPKPYTEGTIIQAMQTAGKLVDDKEDKEILKKTGGIGTVATRGETLKAIQKIGYIVSEKNVLHVTPKGEILCEAIKGSLLASPIMTAKWESYLSEIGNGKGTQEAFLKNIEKFLRTTINEAEKQVETLKSKIDSSNKKEDEENKIATCPSCKNSVVDKGKFYGCSNYPDCKFTLSKDFRKKKLTKKNIEELLAGKETIITNLKSKKGSNYNAKVGLNDKNFIDFLEFAKK